MVTDEFLHYMSSFVTKQKESVKATYDYAKKKPKQTVEERNAVVGVIKKGEDPENVNVNDIGKYVQNDLKIGWKTASKELEPAR